MGDQIKKNAVSRACSMYLERRGAYRVLVGNLVKRDHLHDLSIDGENNIKIDLPEVGWGNMVWIDLAQDGDMW